MQQSYILSNTGMVSMQQPTLAINLSAVCRSISWTPAPYRAAAARLGHQLQDMLQHPMLGTNSIAVCSSTPWALAPANSPHC